MAQCLIGMGANLGDRAATLTSALAELAAPELRVVQASSFWRTAPVGGSEPQPEFLNAAAVLETSLAPEPLLARLLEVEHRLGRVRTDRWAARVIDLDLLLYDEQVLALPQLTVPHPRLAFRWFAVAPAAEIAPHWVHPQLGWTLERLRQHLAEAPNYVALCGLADLERAVLARDVLAEVPGDLVTDRSLSEHAEGLLEEQLGQAALLGPYAPGEYPAEGEHWLVSDFWLEQALVEAWAAGEPTEAFEEQLELLAPTLLHPKLLVYLHRPPLAEEARLVRALEQQLTAPDRGPVLRVAANDPSWARRELIAALRAMRPDARL